MSNEYKDWHRDTSAEAKEWGSENIHFYVLKITPVAHGRIQKRLKAVGYFVYQTVGSIDLASRCVTSYAMHLANISTISSSGR